MAAPQNGPAKVVDNQILENSSEPWAVTTIGRGAL
jgi:hypothetical protein